MTEQDPNQVYWGDPAWIEATPTGEKFMVSMAPRGFLLYRQASSGDFAELVFGFLYTCVVMLTVARRDDAWKVGVFRSKSFRWPRCLFKRTGLTQEEAEREVERLRADVRLGNLHWSQP